eukprot:1156009-Pelagomonas_calceolata.AAC.4
MAFSHGALIKVYQGFGETLSSLLVRDPFLHARGLLAGILLSSLFLLKAYQALSGVQSFLSLLVLNNNYLRWGLNVEAQVQLWAPAYTVGTQIVMLHLLRPVFHVKH